MMMTIGVGAAIRARREEVGMSIQDLAGRTGMRLDVLQKYEEEAFEWLKCAYNLADVADELGVCPGWLPYNGKCPRGYIPEAGGDAAGDTP